MKLDISQIPFSRYGSFFALNFNGNENKLMLRDIHGGDGSPSELFELLVVDGNGKQLNWDRFIFDTNETCFSILDAQTNERVLELIFPTAETIHVRVHQHSIQFKAIKVRYDSFNEMVENEFEYISYKKESKYRLQFLNNDYELDSPWKTVGNGSIDINLHAGAEMFVESYRVIPLFIEPQSFDKSRKELNNDYNQWYDSLPEVEEHYIPSKEMASYLLWSNTVRKEGLLTEEVTFMSKNWMQNIWSWDNCFNAMLLAENHPELAFNQLKIFIDYQDESGAYPDFINDKYVSYNCVKPPIHAWAYKLMCQMNPVFKEEKYLRIIYNSLVDNTMFWLNHRKDKETELLYYTHGNDSGWDNASLFHEGFPVSSPDLVAYLVQQLDILAEFALCLNLSNESNRWKCEADELFETLMSNYIVDKQFVAIDIRTTKVIKQQTSALLFIPLVLAYRFEKGFTDRLVDQLLERFEGDFGIATEEYTSEKFQGDGYWLGPIWAPQTFIFVDALMRAGLTDAGQRIARKYNELTLRGGMAENFNPLTGEGNDDLAFAWTSSVFLLLADVRFNRGG